MDLIKTSLEKYEIKTRAPETISARNNFEYLIQQIVESTNARDKKSLARRLAIFARTFGWTEMDLHGLLQKKNDPSIRNYSAFVEWSIKSTVST